MAPRLRNLLLASTTLLALATSSAVAQPTGGTVVGGSATISGAGTNSVVVNQSTDRAIINWNTFNVSTGGSATFQQPGSSSITLNRVTGGLGPSVIDGTITANGRVFIINRDGMLFGRNAVINTAGFLASTNDIRNDEFMAGRMNFNIPGRGSASIVNLGTITASSHGFAALVAPGVRNSGTISARLGTVALASGNSFTLDMYGDKLIQLAVGDEVADKVMDVATGKPLSSLVSNDGTLRANGGRVELTAAAARHIVDSVINNRGVIEANSIGTRNGKIVLGGATTRRAGLPKQTIKLSGRISASGQGKGATGGTIQITGEDIQFAAAMLDVSGHSGGGKILVGGDYGGGRPLRGGIDNQSAALEGHAIPTAATVTVDGATTFDASATANGNGGKVILWSDTLTTFAGTILARGGEQDGNGGFVEVSGEQRLAFTGSVDTRAPHGQTGTLLLDPADLYIDSEDGPQRPDGATVMTNVQVQDLLASNDLVIATDNSANPAHQSGDITVNASIAWSGGNSLTLSAYRNIVVDANISISNSGAGNLILRADSTGTGTGTVSFSGVNTVVDFTDSTGTVSIVYNPDQHRHFYKSDQYTNKYDSPTDYSQWVATNSDVENQLTAYMLVNTASDLQLLGTSFSLDKAYALGRDIDAADVENFAPIGNSWNPFNGIFEGNGHTISNATITGSHQDNHIGLFGSIGTDGAVRHLTLAGFQVSANSNPDLEYSTQFIGTLAGANAGTISNVTITDSIVDGGNVVGVIAGGLVGQNGVYGEIGFVGTITNSTASATVSVANGCPGDCRGGFNSAGGLVGANVAGSTITLSSAAGGVTGGAYSFIGGLAGENRGSITDSWASAAANSTVAGSEASSAVGGLVGFNTGLISGSHASGNVSGVGSAETSFAAIIGGLVGLNNEGGQIVGSHATGTVSGTNQMQLGGLVGGNFGAVTNSYATGAVTGDGQGTAGGLAGSNVWGATITGSYATGSVTLTMTGATDAIGGGLVGANEGEISGSYATGAVSSTDGDVILGGLAGYNTGTIAGSHASGNVTAATTTLATLGGLVGGNAGTITQSHATGHVSTSAAAALAGGFVGLNFGKVDLSFAKGNVSAGDDSFVGGFVGFNVGEINQAYAIGAITGGANSFVGGFVGINLAPNFGSQDGLTESALTNNAITASEANLNYGSITQAYALGPVTGGNEAVAAAFAALNLGSLDEVYGVGRVQGGAGSTLGGLVGSNNLALNLPPDIDFGSQDGTLPTGTATNSYWDMQTTALTVSAGGTGMNTATLSGELPPGFDAQVWASLSYPFLVNIIPNDQNTTPPPPVIPPVGVIPDDPALPPPSQQINYNPLDTSPPQSDPIPDTTQFVQQQQQQQQRRAADRTTTGSVSQDPIRLDVGDNRYFYLPPPGETRLVSNEVVLQLPCDVPAAALSAILKQHSLTVLGTQCLQAGGNAAYRIQHPSTETVSSVIRALAQHQIIAAAQANYLYALQETSVQSATSQQGDPGQYVPEKLRLMAVHRMVRGTDIRIGVIDSEIDVAHPDLKGAVAGRYDATGAEDDPHPHGTGMAGAIVSHQKLLGVAPGARILAIRAFSSRATNAESTTFHILKGLDWALSHKVRIVNMSFAGPRDPSLERALKAAYDKGVILIAAAGNAGPRAPPLYPAADPHVIAVTATDMDDQLFSGANRGTHLAIAAPGVDILVPAPAGEYQVTTGTSVATAHISGVVALMLERNAKLTPADVRKILAASAKRLGPTNQFGAGLVNPIRAIEMATPRAAARR